MPPSSAGQAGEVDETEARARTASARVARLATANPSGTIDLVPVTFALTGDRLVTAVDHKPKSTTRLRRLDNIRFQPAVTLLVDHYEDNSWDELWWVRLRGLARVVEDGPDHEAAVAALVRRYEPYVEQPPTGPVIIVEVTEWHGWSARRS